MLANPLIRVQLELRGIRHHMSVLRDVPLPRSGVEAGACAGRGRGGRLRLREQERLLVRLEEKG
jgi:hypothetical protein